MVKGLQEVKTDFLVTETGNGLNSYSANDLEAQYFATQTGLSQSLGLTYLKAKFLEQEDYESYTEWLLDLQGDANSVTGAYLRPDGLSQYIQTGGSDTYLRG